MFSSWSYPQVTVQTLAQSYDYVIIGGGTAGCVLANRLSKTPDVSVLVIERGRVANTFLSRVPLLSSHFASDGSRSRVWKSIPQKHVDNRELDLVGGNSLGGASKINASLYTRGLPGEFNSWAAAGRQGWSYDNIQRYFVLSETDLDQDPNNPSDFHGVSGEWPNRSHKEPFWKHTIHIIKATSALGLPYVEDLNSPLHPSHGCAKMHYTLDENGRRSSTLTAFLPSSLVKQRRDRLHICTCAVVRRIEVTKEDGNVTAEGIWVQADKPSSTSRFVRANKEIILTAGPIGSPQLLMLSGIGPEDHLKEHDIPVMKHLPGVGSNLKDHLMTPVQFRIPIDDSLAQIELRPWIIIKLFLLYILFGTGLLLSPVIELSIFIQSRLLDSQSQRVIVPSKSDVDPALPHNLPDIEIMPISWGDVSKHRQGGLTLFCATLRPTSAGTVRLASSDPLVSPIIDPQYLSTKEDQAVMRRAIRFALRLKDEMAVQKYPIFNAHIPDSESDEDIDRFVRTSIESTSHYTSTCRMAPEVNADGSGGVVDDTLRVHGVKGLRVSDSSIFPNILSTHLCATTVAVAEKCADMIQTQHRGLEK